MSTTTKTAHTDVTPPIAWLVRIADEMNLIDGRTAATTAITGLDVTTLSACLTLMLYKTTKM